mgnify:CR=1 FL=1|tara:strand:+ start:9240 stop:12035 length:2796 start_codon:yes stop_codon:yes gene_type:complete
MATIRKNSKINFYKFVQVKEPSTNARGRAPSGQMEVVKTINNNTVAINNLGATVNSIGKIAQDFKSIQLKRLKIAESQIKNFEADFTETKKKKKFDGFSPAALVKKPSWLEGLFKMLSGLIKAAIIIPALEWLSNPENREKVSRFIEVLSKLATFIFKVSSFGVVNTIEGLYTLLSDESSPWEKIGGLVRGLTGLGTVLLGLRWLSNPTRIITDFGNVLIFLNNNLIRGRRGLLGRAGALGLIAAGAYGSYKLYQYLKEDGSGGGPDPNDRGSEVVSTNIDLGNSGNASFDSDGNFKGNITLGENVTVNLNGDADLDEKSSNFLSGILNLFKSTGGFVPAKFAQGGWINGPQSGYPVSLDGGSSTSFIGHGTEYVARKSDGGAFVVPFDTPGTKTQPNLTNKRLGEAKNLGFEMPGFMQGGTLPKGLMLSQKAAFDHVYNLAKAAGGSKFPEIVAAQAMHETGYLNPNIMSVYNSTNRTNAFGQTGDRGFGTIPRLGFVDGWSKYDNLSRAVKDNIKLWHDVANHPENYNAFGNPLDGIAAVAKAYSPNADPDAIRLGYTTDGYSKGIVNALNVGGFDVKRMASSPLSSSQNSGGSRPRGGGNFFTNNFSRLKNFLGFGADSQEKPTTSSSKNASGTIKPASHPETGSGFTIEGTRDQSNRPIVLSEPAAQQFAAAMKASGMDLASYVASSGRSRAKNSAIGGHPESHHLFGEALDINGEGYQWLKANGRRFGWEYVYNHNAGSAHFKYVGPKAGSTPILAAPGDNAAGGNSLHGHVGEGSREGSRDTGRSKVMSPEAKTLFDELFKTPSSAEGMRIGGGRGPAGTAPASQFQQARQQRQLQEQTKTRDNARKQLIERSQEMIREVMAAVAQQNGVNTQAIQSAQQALAVVAGQANGGGSQFLNTGSGGSSSTTIASSLQSVLNPLRGIIR